MVVNGKTAGLPFWQKASEVVSLARVGRGVVVMPTGTGKTTQTPQALHEAGFTLKGQIYVSVPTRVLASELARRVADEMQSPLGDLVGYEIRGEARVSRGTRIFFMTEGILRAKIRRNPVLEGVSVILFDEFHTRSLMSDFNVALVERAQNEGSAVAFLLMSATADAVQLTSHFGCGVVDGSDLSTLYPITERYVGDEGDVFGKVAQEVRGLIRTQTGNGLVFMPGKGEISATIQAIKELGLQDVVVLPLHGDLQGEEHHAPFLERPGITITVATDIVETGATLPGIGWVIDSGLAREVGYDPISDTSSLGVVQIAQDRLNQRRGRCGRVQPGQYVGLFTNKAERPTKTVPEIMRRPLREVVLTIKALGLSREGKPLRLIDNPEKANWRGAKRQLQLLKFVDGTPEAGITELGRKAVELGCDPRDAAILLGAAELGCVGEAAIAIAARQSKPLLIRPRNQDEVAAAQTAQAKFKTSQTCDAWTAVQIVRTAEARGEEALGAWCRENYVSYRALKDVWMVAAQLMRSLGYSANERGGTEENLRRAIMRGLPDRVFTRSNRDWYVSESGSAVLGRESAIISSDDHKIGVWEMIEISTRRGKMRIITNAVVIP